MAWWIISSTKPCALAPTNRSRFDVKTPPHPKRCGGVFCLLSVLLSAHFQTHRLPNIVGSRANFDGVIAGRDGVIAFFLVPVAELRDRDRKARRRRGSRRDADASERGQRTNRLRNRRIDGAPINLYDLIARARRYF